MRDVSAGHWYLGLDLPWLATPAMVASKLRALGLTDIKVHPRRDSLPVDPRSDPSYRDKWDTWVEATYAGPPRSVDLGSYARWLVPGHAGAPAPAAPAPTPPAPAPTKNSGHSLVFVVVAFLLVFARPQHR